MGKMKRKKLVNALDRLLNKNEIKMEQNRKAEATQRNLEKAKKNQIKPKKTPTTDIITTTTATTDTTNAATTSNRPRPQFSSKDQILLIGEGNFSFARSLCENYLEEGAEGLIATCYDTEEVLYQKYKDEAKDNIDFVRDCGGKILFEVDATSLPREVKKNRYTKIVFNFPHAGAGIKDQDRNIVANQRLLNGFFDSVAPLLTKKNRKEIPATKSQDRKVDVIETPDGEIHTTLKTCKPYNLWAVKTLVKVKGVLAVRGTIPFFADDFPGYEHRRTLGFKEGLSKGGNVEINSSEPKTYIFVRKEVMDKENEKSMQGSLKRKAETLQLKMNKKVRKKKGQQDNLSDDE